MGGFCVYFYSAVQRSRATSQCFMFCYGKWGFNGYGDLLKHANIYGNKAKKEKRFLHSFNKLQSQYLVWPPLFLSSLNFLRKASLLFL